ncbi:MAG TPA: methenyltetrahydromethanopterin cyclohydrolase, partial [Burkholderiaceae bacterium]|nr:methenyltetrahydromethanopterin cyclohydrolase [Burkholderiaceae bacterium]
MSDDTVHPAPLANCPLSVNALAAPLVQRLIDQADALGLRVQREASGVTLIDAGIDAPGSIAAGLVITEICLGGLGRVRLRSGNGGWPDALEVASAQPLLACLGSQYAGWSLAASKEETGGKKFF